LVESLSNKYLELTSRSPEQTQQLGRRIGELAEPGDVILLSGELGAGKTCFTQGIVWGLGIEEYALSPTFVIMRELYGRLTLYHIDLYRLDNIEESIDLGLDEYLYGEGICVVEWAEKAMDILPGKYLMIKMGHLSDMETGRNLHIEANGQRYTELLDRIRESSLSWQGV